MAEPRNVVLLVADSLRWDTVHRGPTGLPYLGGRGLRFDQARSGGCWTLPATASMFTGLSPHEHGADAQTRSINNAPTLAERMKRLGLSTHMVTANVATTDIFGLDRGFDTLDRVWKLVPATAHRRLHEALVLAGKPRLRQKILSKDFVMGKMSEDLDASKVWLHEKDLLQIHRGVFAKNAYVKSWGCHSGESFSKKFASATGGKMIGAKGKTQYMDEELPILSTAGGYWIR